MERIHLEYARESQKKTIQRIINGKQNIELEEFTVKEFKAVSKKKEKKMPQGSMKFSLMYWR